jgi:hypothetical protein
MFLLIAECVHSSLRILLDIGTCRFRIVASLNSQALSFLTGFIFLSLTKPASIGEFA